MPNSTLNPILRPPGGANGAIPKIPKPEKSDSSPECQTVRRPWAHTSDPPTASSDLALSAHVPNSTLSSNPSPPGGANADTLQGPEIEKSRPSPRCQAVRRRLVVSTWSFRAVPNLPPAVPNPVDPVPTPAEPIFAAGRRHTIRTFRLCTHTGKVCASPSSLNMRPGQCASTASMFPKRT